MENNTLTALHGVQVGNSTHLDKLTGCTFVLFDNFYPTAYKSYGGAVGAFNTEILKNGTSFPRSNGLFIAGGSLTGLMSATPITEEMIKKGIGSKTNSIINPVIRGAIVLDMGTHVAQYNPEFGREAFSNLTTDPVQSGNVGAGTGTTVGKFQYLEQGTKMGGMKGGLGNAKVKVGERGLVCALSVVNAVGNVVKPDGTILAGNRDELKKFKEFGDTIDIVTSEDTNTTITIVGTNIKLSNREDYERLAHFAAQGQIRAINPANMSIDGDTVFVFSTEEVDPFNSRKDYFETVSWPKFSVDIIGHAVAKAVQESIYDACLSAETIQFEQAYNGVIPSVKDYSL